MLHLHNISFEFGGHYLFKHVDWFIKAKQRIGLVGKNGAGKSTLLKIITGEYELREGKINKQSGLKIGYLSQDMISEDDSLSVLETAKMAFKEPLALHEHIEELLLEIEKDPNEDNIQQLADAQEKFAALGGYDMEFKTAEILEGLGFSTRDLDRPMREFSGGWRMRVILARMLLEQPDVMLMDEPTNHLDLPSIEWLESYLSNYPGAVIIVSHDREFLNKMTNSIAELSNQQLYVWSGNYDFYLHAKVERDDLLQRKLENQKQYIKDQEKFINRFRYKASKAKAVQSRVKMLDKLDRIDPIEQDTARMNLDFKVAQRSGKVVMQLKNIDKFFGKQQLFKHTDVEIERGDKIALIGANGTGKSTFLRIIADTEAFTGTRTEGHNVQASFYAQHQLESLDLKAEILDELKHTAPSKSETELRSLLGCFLFSGEDVYKKIKVLSGGEKARVALSKTLVTEANFLLLDEPTNHLDIDSIEILIDALARYEGTLIIVSHNRYFISRLANKIWWIEGQDVKSYPGSYDEYHERLEQQNHTKDHKQAMVSAKSSKNKSGWKQKDEAQEQLKRKQKALVKAESALKALKDQLSSLHEQVQEAAVDQLEELGHQMKKRQADIDKQEQLCEAILEEIIALEEQS